MKCSKYLSIAAGVALIALSAGPAAANPPFLEDGTTLSKGYAIELGAVQHGGATEFSSIEAGIGAVSQGLVLRDRNGGTARMIMGALIMVAGAAAASSPKKVEQRTYRSGDYKITETKTTYRSPAEQQAIMAASAGAAAGIFASEMAEFELEVFSRDRFGFGDSSGHKLNMLFGGGDDSFYFEGGVGWGNVNSIVQTADGEVHLDHKYFGIPFRVGGAISKVAWTATWEWNWLAHGVEKEERLLRDLGDGKMGAIAAYHPLRIEAQMSLFGRAYGQIGMVLPKPLDALEFDIGWRASAGLRF